MVTTRIDCPNCGHYKEIPSDKMPQKEVMVTCPQCKYRFNYNPLQDGSNFIFETPQECSHSTTNSDIYKCPNCNRTIVQDACECNYCNFKLTMSPKIAAPEKNTSIPCKFCHEPVHQEAVKCKHCGGSLTGSTYSEYIPPQTHPAMPTPKITNISDWLTSIGMSEYINIFRSNNIDMNNLHAIAENDLVNMGISSIGHRKLLLNEISNHLNSTVKSDSTQQFVYLQVLYYIVLVIADVIIFNVDASFDWKIAISVGLLILSFIYFLPTTIAFKKGNEYRWGIFIVNTFFGVSFVGWVIALAVAMGWLSGQTGALLAFLAPNRGLSRD